MKISKRNILLIIFSIALIIIEKQLSVNDCIDMKSVFLFRMTVEETLIYSNQHESILLAVLILRDFPAPPLRGGALISASLIAQAYSGAPFVMPDARRPGKVRLYFQYLPDDAPDADEDSSKTKGVMV